MTPDARSEGNAGRSTFSSASSGGIPLRTIFYLAAPYSRNPRTFFLTRPPIRQYPHTRPTPGTEPGRHPTDGAPRCPRCPVSDSAKSGSSLFPQFGALAVVAAVLTAVVGGKPAASKPPGDDPPGAQLADAPPAKPPAPQPATHLTKLREFGILGRPPMDVPLVSPDVRFLVMTVPDPAETQFGTRFDQMIDALCRAMAEVRDGDDAERAAQTRELGRFTLERFWYPWPLEGKKPDAAEGVPAYKTSPGLLVFRGTRRPERKWVVFLVGESPVAGVHREAFRAALTCAAAQAAPGPRTVRVIGPNFSGSQVLLMPDLLAWQKETGVRVDAISGTAAGLQPTAEVLKRLGVADPAAADAISFRLTAAPTKGLNQAVLHYLAKSGDTRPDTSFNPAAGELAAPPPEHVAYLVESNSGFGNLAADTVREGSGSPWVLRFPMHLSRVSGIQSHAARQREEQLGLAPPNGAQFRRLDEQRKGGDLLPSADEQRTALVNQRLLQEYWETLRREGVRYVGVVASDPRDTIFLIGQMRKEVPNAVVFVYGIDLQLTHPEYLAQTRGVLTVSSYPLYPIAQQWAKRDLGENRVDSRRVPFATSGAEGTYNAVLIQCGRPDKLLDYRPPQVTDPTIRRPAVWVSTIGEDGTLLPLAYFDRFVSPVLYECPADVVSDFPVAAHPPQTPPLRHLMLALIGAAVYGGVAIRRAFGRPAAGPDAMLVRRLKYQYATLIGVGLLLGCLPLGIYFYDLAQQPPAGRSVWGSGTDGLLLVVALALGGVVGGFGLLSLPCQLVPALDRLNPLGGKKGRPPARSDTADRRPGTRPPPPGPWAERLPMLLHVVGVVAAFGVIGAVCVTSLRADPGTRLLYMERAAHLGAGCSPILAGGFMALGLFLYGVLALALLRLQTDYHVDCPYPRMSESATNPEKPHFDILNRIADQTDRMNGLVFGLWTLMRRKGRTFLVALTAAAALLVVPPLLRAHGTWEGGAWDLAFLGGIATLFGLAFLSTFRVYAIWRDLERLLRLIGRVPMVGAFDRLPAEAYRVFSQYLLNGRRRGEDILIPHALLVRLGRAGAPVVAPATATTADIPQAILNRLRNVRLDFEEVGVAGPGAGPADATGTAHALERVPTTGAVGDARPDGDEGPMGRELSGVQASEFSAVSRELVTELVPHWVGRPIPDAYGHQVGAAATEADADEPGWQGVAEQFIAIQAVIFVAQYFHQLRLMAYMAALPAGALLMAVTSYPFMPERLIMYSAVGVVAAVLGVLLWVLYRINKNTIVSRVTRTTPGRLSLDAGLVQNFVAFVLPLLLIAVVQVGGRWRTVVEPVLDMIR